MMAAERTARDKTISVTVVVTPRFPIHALALCIDALRVANREASKTVFAWQVASETGKPVISSAGIEIRPDTAVAAVVLSQLIIVLAGYEPDTAAGHELVRWLKRQSRRGASLGCVDTGALLLARAGLISDRRVSVHADALDGAREDYRGPQFSDCLCSFDGRRFSSAGGIATFDMMLALIEHHQGRALADRVARMFNHARRDASQMNGQSSEAAPLSPALLSCIDTMKAHMEDPLSLELLSKTVAAPVWTLRRLFRRHFAMTPSAYYRNLRLARARQLLAYSHLSVAEIATACGFSDIASFSRAFSKRFGVSPSRARCDEAGLPVTAK